MNTKILLFYACLPAMLFAQPSFIASLYPPQHGLNIPADAELRVGLQAPLDPASLSDSSIYVWSDITGLHRLTVTLENGNRDLRIVPQHWRLNDRPAFNAGERVTVTLTTRLRYADGRQFEGFSWHYAVAVRQNHGGDFKPLAIFGGDASTYFYVSDFNGDGWADVIGDDGVLQKMVVFLNDGKGRLLFDHRENIVTNDGEIADLNHDGSQDLICCGDRFTLNDGRANFSEVVFPERPIGFAKSHDFNNDGIMDFAIGNYIPDTLYFGLSSNVEPFKRLQKVISPVKGLLFYVPGLSYDLNNDGRIDFLYVGDTVVGTGTGGFASFQATSGDSLQQLQIRELWTNNFYGNDFDGDRDIDYVFTYGDANRFITFFNYGDGLLQPSGMQRDTIDARLWELVEGGDFDGDGDIDLAFASSNFVSAMPETYEPDISVFLNDGKGSFSLSSRIRLLFNLPLSRRFRAIDFDRDGDLDLIGIANGLFYVVANGSYATGVDAPQASPIPIQFELKPIHPNPVKTQANIELQLHDGTKEEVRITIFDVSGRRIRSWLMPGREKTILLSWDVRDQNLNPLPDGVYFVQAQMGKVKAVQKLLLLK